MANHLYCGAKVVGGHQEALTFLEKNKDDFNIRKIKRNADLLLLAQCCKAESRGAEIKFASWSRSRNNELWPEPEPQFGLRLREARVGAERNTFGSTTLLLTSKLLLIEAVPHKFFSSLACNF